MPVPWGTIGSVAGSVLGGLLGGGKKMTPEQRLAYEQAVGAGALGLRRAGEIAPYTTGMLGLAQEGYQPAFDYWSRILSGDRSEITSVLSPEIARIGEGYTQARREVGQFAPRGGGRASTLGEIPFRRGRDVSELFATMRPLAAQSLGQLAGEAGRLGATTGFLEAQLGGMPISAAQATMPWLEQAKQNWWNRIMQGAKGGGEIGSWLGDILETGKKKPGTSSSGSAPKVPLGGGSSGGGNILQGNVSTVSPWLASITGASPWGRTTPGERINDPFRRAP